MPSKIYKSLLTLATAGLLLSACKKWDDHNAITDANVDKDLFTQISENTNLSKFTELLIKTGYDKVIASSKTFTVFAPTNAALATLDPAIANDGPKLRLFVANHIANQTWQTNAAITPLRLKMLSDKYNNMLGNKLEDATIAEADHYAKNGVFHIIDKLVPALPNTWEFIESNPEAPSKQKDYLLSLFRNVFDTTNAVQIGVDPATGKPIYQPGTDSVKTNLFWRNVYDLRDEKKQYTLFVLANDAWDTEVTKYKPFYVTGSDDSTVNLANWSVVKDFAIEGVYDAATIPDTILSKFNIKVGIEKSAIAKTVKTSNGVVFIMNKIAVRPIDKYPPLVIQAENYNTVSNDRRGNTYFREKYNPVTGYDFRDVLVYNHGVALFNLGYRLSGMPSIKYKAYWVAVHDNINGSTATFTQKLGIGTATSTLLPYVTVNLNNYNEVYLGEFPLTVYNPTLMIYLTAFNGTAAIANTLVCDYIRLVPVL
ncbi:fasciclin domain-containing protein [Paraflavitalea soli]|uniref:Fasciclin domain-containing protein n=1 Tax=Paraflavitalea soli TaxID=2315862 RepID=A0A3B7N0J0_9BACT|nr:fasciclin domain-containing protein [Paraflavitalea soli]AXY75951.1 fasciclin domain-containing protein [Paraflavitalea soli]